MGTYRLRLLFENRAGHAAHIEVVSSMLDDEGRQILTPECRSIGELEHHVGRLKEDLDRALVEARRKFAKPRPPLFPEK